MYDNGLTKLTQDVKRVGATPARNFASLLSVIKEDEDAMCDDIILPQEQPSTKHSLQRCNAVTVSAHHNKQSLKGLKGLARAADDDDCFIDEDVLMNEPLQLITRNKAMRVDSGLLRLQQPAV